MEKKNNAVVIICTRPESSRLKRKAFIHVAKIPAIHHILTRLGNLNTPVVLAVPSDCHEYDYLIDLYRDTLDLRIIQGDPDSPLHRMQYAFESYAKIHKEREPEWIIRITHDDILIDTSTIMGLLEECRNGASVGYGISPDIVDGAGVEIIHKTNLKHAAETHKNPTEYISYFVKYFPRKNIVKYTPRYSVKRNYRMTMDYPEDWTLLDIVLNQVGPFASLDQVVDFLDHNSYLLNINRQPAVSIYTCAYNAEKWVEQTIHSVTNQDHNNFEYIFIDDHSTDNTPLIISKFLSDKRIKFQRLQKNIGLASASNLALSLARGKRIMRVDADDKLMLGSLKRMENYLNDSKAGIVYPAYFQMTGDGTSKETHDPRIRHHAGCALMDSRLINELRFTNNIRHWDSLDLYNRIKGRFDIAHMDEPVWYYRRHEESMSADKNNTERKEALKEITP